MPMVDKHESNRWHGWYEVCYIVLVYSHDEVAEAVRTKLDGMYDWAIGPGTIRDFFCFIPSPMLAYIVNQAFYTELWGKVALTNI